MKKVWMSLFLCLFWSANSVSANPTNLLDNSGFENGSSDWSIVNWNGASSTVTDEEAYSGNSSIKTVHARYNNGTYGGSWSSIAQNVSSVMDPDEMYQLSFAYQTTSSDGFSFRFGDIWQVMHSSGIVGVNPIADGEWHTVISDVFSRSASQLSYEPMLSFYYDYNVNMGTVYLDDISLAAAPVPEPSTYMLLGSGLIGLVYFRRKGVEGLKLNC